MLKTVSSITNAIGALNYKGTWDANANSPALTSSVGTKGDYYVVDTAGATNLNGVSNWGVGDWATFNGSVWQRVEGGADLNGVNLSVSGATTLSGLDASTALALDASKNVVGVANTGTGNNVLADGPTLTTPTLGVASVTSINKVAVTAPDTGSTLTIADGKTLTANASLTLAGTDATTMTFPSTSATIARTNGGQTFTGTQTFGNVAIGALLGTFVVIGVVNNGVTFTFTAWPDAGESTWMFIIGSSSVAQSYGVAVGNRLTASGTISLTSVVAVGGSWSMSGTNVQWTQSSGSNSVYMDGRYFRLRN